MRWLAGMFVLCLPWANPVRGEGTTMDSTEAKLPLIKSMQDVRAHEGVRARIEGRYEVAPIAGSKRLQPVVIVLADGESLIRFYRPRPEEFGFLDKRVVIIGKAYIDANQDPTVQQVMAPHVEAERIDLAPGETARDPAPTELPTPPLAKDRASFEKLDGRWLRVEGELVSLTPRPDESMWSLAVLRLPDGTQVERSYTPDARWREHLGRKVTVIGRAQVAKTKPPTLHLVDLAEICPGSVPRCGMPKEPPPMQQKIR